MRRIIDAVFISLDGVMQAPGGPEEDPTGGFTYGGWVAPWFDDMLGEHIDEVMGPPFDLLLGRRTYEIFAAHWPYAEPGDAIGEKFKTLTKYVATRSAAPLTWGPAQALHDAAADVARLKQADGPRLLVQGSSVLVQTLLAADLIDELHLIQVPVVLGQGKRFFGEGTRPAALKHTGAKVTTTGVVITSYLREGALTTGSFAFDTPSQAERDRREKMKREG